MASAELKLRTTVQMHLQGHVLPRMPAVRFVVKISRGVLVARINT